MNAIATTIVPQSTPCADRLKELGEHLSPSPYRINHETVMRFWVDGFLGPLACHAPELDTLLADLTHASNTEETGAPRNVYDPQLGMAAINRLACHPSIAHPVAQLLGSRELSFFQARFRVKMPGWNDDQPWHQDVGKNHGGLQHDGRPIPSLTIWLSLDGAGEDSGGVVLLPGSHRHLLGDWKAGYHGMKDVQNTLDTSNARSLVTPARCFHIFNSWAVHCSRSNTSARDRSALILRYMDRRHAINADFTHYPCRID